MQMFLNGLSLRECCYVCGFRGQNIAADITLADFWGVDQVRPDLHDDQGVSLVLVHTEKGKALLDSASQTLSLTEVDAQQALQHNTFMSRSHARSPRREKYLKALPHRRFAYLYKKCYGSTNTEKLKTFIAKRLGYKS